MAYVPQRSNSKPKSVKRFKKDRRFFAHTADLGTVMSRPVERGGVRL